MVKVGTFHASFHTSLHRRTISQFQGGRLRLHSLIVGGGGTDLHGLILDGRWPAGSIGGRVNVAERTG